VEPITDINGLYFYRGEGKKTKFDTTTTCHNWQAAVQMALTNAQPVMAQGM